MCADVYDRKGRAEVVGVTQEAELAVVHHELDAVDLQRLRILNTTAQKLRQRVKN